jgi:hypothetical protein
VPSWAYLVVLMFAAMLAWPTIEHPVLRFIRRLRRRLTRGRTLRRPYSYRRDDSRRPPQNPPSAKHPHGAA